MEGGREGERGKEREGGREIEARGGRGMRGGERGSKEDVDQINFSHSYQNTKPT